MAVRVGLIGVGTVGQSVARRLLGERETCVRLTRVCTRPGGRPRPGWLPTAVGWTDRFDALLESDIDVVVELVGGLTPAREWIERALLAGKSVVTANKQLLAEAGPDLSALAARQQCRLRFEGAVGGGVPIIRAVEDGLAGDRLVRIVGVLNGTCNYILTRMEQEGLSFADALAEAQARGYAEPDPAADVDGLDARAKLTILCAVAFGTRVDPRDIPCASIATVTPAALARARAAGFAVRQVSQAERLPGGRPGTRASVGPALVPLNGPLARAQGCENVIVVGGRFGGETVFSGQGAGGDATAVAVLSDLIAIAAERSPRVATNPFTASPVHPPAAFRPDSDPSFSKRTPHHA
jgi:homoserine dehydrogenase